jgi:hypothetical protein
MPPRLVSFMYEGPLKVSSSTEPQASLVQLHQQHDAPMRYARPQAPSEQGGEGLLPPFERRRRNDVMGMDALVVFVTDYVARRVSTMCEVNKQCCVPHSREKLSEP